MAAAGWGTEMMRGPLERRGDAAEIFLKVNPGAAREAIGGVAADGQGLRRLQVSVTVVAEGGRANKAVVRLLAKSWKIAPSALEVTAGQASRLKRLRLAVPPEKLHVLERLLD